jgi:dTDP-4-dehydrorhamnose reductase
VRRPVGVVGAHVCHVSSDYVFGGAGRRRPYTEHEAAEPQSVYGRTTRAYRGCRRT